MVTARSVRSKLAEVVYRDGGDPHSLVWSFFVNGVVSSYIFSARVRPQLLRLLGLKISRRATVRPGAFFRSKDVTIGDGSFIGYHAFFDCRAGIKIGKNVSIGSRTVFVDSDHDISNPKNRAGVGVRRPIVINDGARISTRSMILPGVTIGEGAVIGAGSLVTKDVEPHSLYYGVPAVKRRELPR